MNTQREEAKRLKDRVEAITGEFYCTGGHHRTRGEFVIRKGRRVCIRCNQRMQDRMGKTTPHRG